MHCSNWGTMGTLENCQIEAHVQRRAQSDGYKQGWIHERTCVSKGHKYERPTAPTSDDDW